MDRTPFVAVAASAYAAYRTPGGRNWIEIRGPHGLAVFGIACSHSRWHAPPITNRSPWPSMKRADVAAAAGSEQQGSRGTERDDRDQGVLGAAAADGVAVPRDAVASVAVQAEPGGRESLGQHVAVVRRQPNARLGKRRVRQRRRRRRTSRPAAGRRRRGRTSAASRPATGQPRSRRRRASRSRRPTRAGGRPSSFGSSWVRVRPAPNGRSVGAVSLSNSELCSADMGRR